MEFFHCSWFYSPTGLAAWNFPEVWMWVCMLPCNVLAIHPGCSSSCNNVQNVQLLAKVVYLRKIWNSLFWRWKEYPLLIKLFIDSANLFCILWKAYTHTHYFSPICFNFDPSLEACCVIFILLQKCREKCTQTFLCVKIISTKCMHAAYTCWFNEDSFLSRKSRYVGVCVLCLQLAQDVDAHQCVYTEKSLTSSPASVPFPEKIVERLTAAILDLVELYCSTFNANFHTAPHSSRPTAPIQEAGMVTNVLSFNIYAAHRVPITWAAR